MSKLVKNNQQFVLAISADIESSRLLTQRELVQIGLRQLLAQVNAERHEEIIVPFSISRGDEVQGLLGDPMDLFPVIDGLDLDTDLFTFRFGIGWGAVDTARADRTWEMDGGCFHAARRAIERGRSDGRWVTVEGFGAEGDRALNAVFRVMQALRSGWTKKQRRAVRTRKASTTQTAAARDMGFTKSTLSKMLKSAHHKELLEMEGAVRDLVHLCVSDSGGGE